MKVEIKTAIKVNTYAEVISHSPLITKSYYLDLKSNH